MSGPVCAVVASIDDQRGSTLHTRKLVAAELDELFNQLDRNYGRYPVALVAMANDRVAGPRVRLGGLDAVDSLSIGCD